MADARVSDARFVRCDGEEGVEGGLVGGCVLEGVPVGVAALVDTLHHELVGGGLHMNMEVVLEEPVSLTLRKKTPSKSMIAGLMAMRSPNCSFSK